MRKTILMMMALGMSIGLGAQESRWQFDIGVAERSIYAQYEDYLGFEDLMDNEWKMSAEKMSVKDIDRHCYDVLVSPTVSARVAYRIGKRWAAVAGVGYNYLEIDYFNSMTDEEKSQEETWACDALLGARYYFFQNVNFYVQALFGTALQGNAEYWNRNAESKKETNIPDLPYRFGYQLCAGYQFDFCRHFYVGGEVGVGTEQFGIVGGRVCIGLKL